ncbi:MAG: hypothetical protein E6L08_08170 [Verrucomicrobia bacterium]|nr:MAG: hypothetical protein DME71_00900 [Verrucomicrobiota bacterium]TMP92464.1 MAG: hypothetical protein E6L08_08170 [Verrucomicrobiota bacterium]
MKPLTQFKTTIPPLLVSVLLICLGLAPMARAVGPDTDGTLPGSNNGEGIGVLVSRTTGVWNTGTGFEALSQLTAGNQNTATGLRALTSDTNGGFNTATGVLSLFSNTSGFFNSATGAYSLANNINGSNNTANGYAALYRNTAEDNTATGFAALYHNTTGDRNSANGSSALLLNTEGIRNTAIGAFALQNNTTGDNNIALGHAAGSQVTTASDVICIGTDGQNVNNSCYIGSIFGQTASGGTQVFINPDGKLGTATSSRRFKEEIKPMKRASEALFALKPVTFRYKKGIDSQGIPQFGLVAEDVEAVNRDLVVRDKEGKVNTVRYEAVNAMLLNEFLKEHRNVKKLESIVAHQQKQIEALTSGLEKVTAQLELNKPAPRTVSNK